MEIRTCDPRIIDCNPSNRFRNYPQRDNYLIIPRIDPQRCNDGEGGKEGGGWAKVRPSFRLYSVWARITKGWAAQNRHAFRNVSRRLITPPVNSAAPIFNYRRIDGVACAFGFASESSSVTSDPIFRNGESFLFERRFIIIVPFS